MHDPLMETVLGLLRDAPDGLSEHGLLSALARAEPPLLEAPFSGLVATFRAHCLLFNTLYRLRDRLWERGEAHLEISPLSIRLLPYLEGRAGLAETDPVRDYYLDLEALEDIDEDDVARLLASFYARLRGGPLRTQALAELGLEDPVDDDEIKRTYRRLVQHCHPDRGGDTARLQALNAAIATLIP
jgi:hypothetical protein